MLTIVDIDRAVDRLGGAAFVPNTRRVDSSRLEPEIILPEHRLSIGRPVSFAFRRASGIRHRVTGPPLRRGA